MLSADDVQVWLVDLRAPRESLDRFDQWLSADEKDRADRFRFGSHRRRFVAGRGVLRRLLAQHTGASPADLVFGYGTAGKPHLVDPAGSGLSFNVSHADDVALIAIARDRAVGVDVERVKAARDLERLAARFFSPEEAADFMRLPPMARQGAFYTCWSRKEAFLKARGVGLAGNLKDFAVTLEPGVPPVIRRLSASLKGESQWSLADLTVPGGYVGALASEGDGWQIASRRWTYGDLA